MEKTILKKIAASKFIEITHKIIKDCQTEELPSEDVAKIILAHVLEDYELRDNLKSLLELT